MLKKVVKQGGEVVKLPDINDIDTISGQFHLRALVEMHNETIAAQLTIAYTGLEPNQDLLKTYRDLLDKLNRGNLH